MSLSVKLVIYITQLAWLIALRLVLGLSSILNQYRTSHDFWQ